MNDQYQINFRKKLQEAIGVFKSTDETAAGMRQFDQLAKHGEVMAAEVVLNSIGLKQSAAGIAEWMTQQLTKLGTIPSPESDSSKRIKQLAQRIRKNISNCSISIDNKDYSEYGKEQALLQMESQPLEGKAIAYTATASFQVGDKTFKEFGLEATINSKSFKI